MWVCVRPPVLTHALGKGRKHIAQYRAGYIQMEKNEKKKIDLCLSHQSFRILSDENAEYMKKLESSVNERIEAVQKQYPSMNAARCALLAMLNLEDELQKTKQNFETLESKILQLRGIQRGVPAAQPVRAAAPAAKDETKKPVGVN